MARGITCKGVKNILDFIKSCGSVIVLCNNGSSLFSSSCEWLNPKLKEAQSGEWSKTRSHPGHFYRVCGHPYLKVLLEHRKKLTDPTI
jgi:hypothetical protein